jgi:peptidoglycan/LPS O-acetylase OafA/YrhL
MTASASLPHQSLQYRPAIDGLRTIAVLSVVIFHFQRDWLPGGFVGVDIFFVISGFLITRILAVEIVTGDFSLGRFYKRRIARIMPAFMVVLVATAIGALFIYTDRDIASLGANIVAAAFSVINVKLLLQGDYFTLSALAQPLLHYWSLAVEEQYYLVFPLLLFGFSRLTKGMLLGTLALLIASLVGCILLTPVNNEAAFYLLPTRAWELLGGSLLGVVAFERWQAPRPISTLISLAGIAAIALAFAIIHEGPEFPGIQAILPVIATMLLISQAHVADNPVNRTLSLKPCVWIGKLSYSIYLCHWPIFSLVGYAMFLADPTLTALVKIGILIVAAISLHYLVERPMRRLINGWRGNLAVFGATLVVVALAALGGYQMRQTWYPAADADRIASGGLFIDHGGDRTVTLIGDSHAAMYARTLNRVTSELGVNLRVLASPSRNHLPGAQASLWPDIQRAIEDYPPDVVIMTHKWSFMLAPGSPALCESLRFLVPRTGQVILLTQPPYLPFSAPREVVSRDNQGPFLEPENIHELRITGNRSVRAAVGAGVAVVDVAPLFEGEGRVIRALNADGALLYQDAHHLSDAGTRILHDRFTQAIREALERSPDAIAPASPCLSSGD